MTTSGDSRTCPHCGADCGVVTFCPGCGNRVAGQPRGALASWTIAVLVALVAAPLLLASLVLGLCGSIATIGAAGGGGDDVVFIGALCVGIAIVLGRLAIWLMRTGEAETTGHRVRRFGKH